MCTSDSHRGLGTTSAVHVVCPIFTGRTVVVLLSLLAVIGAVMIVRGVAREILLATDTDGLRATVGPLESRWSLAV
ncbi:MAG: hypothetical protein ABI251_10290 [Mycobacteriaceae bacterium]